MTNVISLHQPEPEFDDGEPTGAQIICRKFMNDALEELKALVLRFQQLQSGYQPGSDVFDYRDKHFDTITSMRNEAKGLCAKYEKRGNELGVPREVIDMMLGQMIPHMRSSCDNIQRSCQMWLDRQRPKATQRSQDFQRLWANDPTPPKKKPHVMDWGHPVGASVGIVCIILLVAMMFGGALKPYSWLGMHNGHLSSGYGLRLGHHRN